MPRFLSDEWVAALGAAAAGIEPGPQLAVAVRHVVGDTSWTVRVGGGTVVVDQRSDADVTLTTDRETAAALVRGELAAQDAVAAGRFRVSGDVTRLVGASAALAGLDSAYAALRATTTYD